MLPVRFKYYCLIFLLLLTPVGLSENLFSFNTSITIDAIVGHGIELHDIELNFDSLLTKNSSYLVRIGSVALPENMGDIKDIILQCNTGVISKQEIECEDGELSFEDQLASAKQSKIQFHRNEQGDIRFNMGSFSLADGVATLNAHLSNDSWQVKVKSNNISFEKLRQRLPAFPEILSSGVMSGGITFIGNETVLREMHGSALVKNLTFSNEESTVVGENVASKLSFSIKRNKNIWQTEINATTFQGELYFDPVFIDANEGPKDLYGVINWELGSTNLELAPLYYEDPNVVHLALNTVIDYEQKAAVTPVQATIKYALFPRVYDEYMQPFLLDTNIADLATQGSFSGSLLMDGSRIEEMDLQFGNLSFEDNQDRFAISKLNGDFGWGERYSDEKYNFSFASADLYKLRLEASEFSFTNNKETLALNKPVSVPLLDGAINIESFQVKQPGKKDQSILMDISLTPVSMPKLSTRLGWPEMNGNLAGYAPNVTYKKGDVDIQGALLIRGFGGSTTIHNLSAKNLFGITPELSADVQLKNLDLRSLTETFSFGEITGRLDGYINNLQFVSWSPVQFDAWLGTPGNDKTKHKINHEAIDILTALGDGLSNKFIKSYIRFLENFNYDRIGIGCRLKNSKCKMRGVSEAGENFYIVKGAGIPRIDVVGFTHEVSWSELTKRLKRVTNVQDVIVN